MHWDHWKAVEGLMFNVKAIIVSRMMSHCASNVHERRVRNRDKKVRRDVIEDESRR